MYFLLVLGSAWYDSATFDEPVHIVSGYYCLSQGRYDVNSFHPPLLKMIAAVPLAYLSPPISIREVADPATLGTTLPRWFWHSAFDAQSVLRACRISLLLAQALAIWWIVGYLAGRFGSASAVAFYLLALGSPSFLGLAGFVTTDTGTMLAMLLSLLAFERVATVGDRVSVGLLTLALFVGLASKHSFLLLPVCLVAGAAFRAWIAARQGGSGWVLVKKVAFAAVTAFLMTIGLYAFCMRGMPYKMLNITLRVFAYKSPPVARPILKACAVHSLLQPVGWYLSGVFRVAIMVKQGPTHMRILSSLGTQVYQGGRWAYFPSILLAKENLVVLVGLALLWSRARTPSQGWRAMALPARIVAGSAVLIATCYFLVALQGSLNIGYRHILPAYLLFLLASALLLGQGQTGRRLRLALLALLLCRVTSLALTYPHCLSYFNALAGGVKNGYKTSVISDADWGQDLLRLRQYVDGRPGARVHLFYASTADTGYYLGQRLAPMDEAYRPGDLVAVSTTFLQIPDYLSPEMARRVEQARSYPVDGQIGGSLVIFRVP